MKFIAAAVVLTLALALGECSVISWPWASEISGHGLAYTAVSGPSPLVLGAPAAISLAQAPAAITLAQSPGVVVAAPAAAPVVVAAAAAEGTYVAKTRGAVHTAPLSGHIQSVANVNVAPAPGTL